MKINPMHIPRILVADNEKSTRCFYIKALQSFKPDKKQADLQEPINQISGKKSSDEFSELLKKQEFELTLCSNSNEAVEQVIDSLEEKKPFSVAFIDVRMPPGPDGIWAAQQIRKLDKDIEIVIATAFSDIPPYKISKQVPPVHKLLYLQKPFHIYEISHMASSLASKWEMEQELFRIHAGLQNTIKQQSNKLSKACQTLEKMQKLDALGMVAGGISHDFNNILSCIIGHTELAILDSHFDKSLNKRLASIHDACFRAKDIVNQILTFSSQGDPEYIQLNPEKTISNVIKLIEGSIPFNIKLVKEIDTIKTNVLADYTQIHQVVMNLCTNAIHAMKEKGGTLTISLGETLDHNYVQGIGPGPHILLSIIDTGKGMDEKTLENIFVPYFTTKAKGEGTGLGLSVTHGIINRQGGLIEIKTKPGKGTSFNIVLKGLPVCPK